MDFKLRLRRWLTSRPVGGRAALLLGIVAVAVPTEVRAAMSGYATGGLMTGLYVPFILASAIVLAWWNASLFALTSVAIDYALFVGSPKGMFERPVDLLAVGVFLIAAGAIIAFVEVVRRMISDQPGAANEVHSGIIFSLEKGQAWASRPGLGAPVRLGPEAEVAEMMEDFLAQIELGKRLNAVAVAAE